ncbi:Tuftelin-interacting protein 11 [Schistosoma japonicum]|nr:Tuftelin-interacting protein 11 [Schistosoma japonicum]
MGSSPEVEKFGLSDTEYAFMMDPLKRRPTQSRKQTIYGIFASDDSDSEPEKSGFGGREAGFKRKGANYSAPITFVSGGVKVGAGNPSHSSENDDQISDDDDDKCVLNSLRSYHDSDSDSPNSDAYQKPGKTADISVGAGRRAAAAAAATRSATSGFGAWERHTKGIGMKLLEQMGYEPGKGLGSEGQGIVTPVQAVQRVGKVSVGFYGSEKTRAPRCGNETVVEGLDLVGPRYKKRPGLLRNQAAKPIQEYKTAEELVANLCPATPAAAVKRQGIFLENSELSKVKVIDMTSKEQKVYSGYEAALSRVVQRRRKPGDNSTISDEEGPDVNDKRIEKRLEGNFFDCPALRHNFALIMRSAEDEIRKFDRAARFEEDRAVGLEHEIERLTEIVNEEESEVNQLMKALVLIKKFEDEVHSGCDSNLTSEAISSWVSLIREECAHLVEMPVLMASIARPMLDNSLAKWNPLKEPAFCLDLLAHWRDFFQNSHAFDVILETSWLSAIRRTIVNEWNPRDCEPLLEVLEAWQPLLPDDILQRKILDQLILPKLQDAVSSWNPLTDTVPVHIWLHPWLPWFGGVERLSCLHDMVLQKLGNCLTNWHPSDASARSVLMPWRTIFPVPSMSAFLSRHIVPKLALALQQFQLNPAKQNMDPWNWVMRWADLIGPAVLVNLLEHHFWSRWLSVLSSWLNQGVEARQRGDNAGASQVYQEVGRWYAGWKGQLPPECMEYASVKDALTKALAMMERSMRGLPPQIVVSSTFVD